MTSTRTMPERAADTASTAACGDRIDGLARRVERLSVSSRDPEKFFEERSEIVDALRQEAARLWQNGA